jgi:uncharacterized protein
VREFIRALLKYREWAVFVVLLTLVLAALLARNIRVQFQFRDFYDFPGNARSTQLKHDTDRFGDPAGFVVALVETERVFRSANLDYVRSLTRALEPDPTFVRIISLSNVHAIRGAGDDVVSGPLLADDAQSATELAELERFALASPLLRRRLISGDGKVTAVLAEMRTPSAYATIAEQQRAIAIVQRAVASIPPPPGVAVRITGAPVVDTGVTRALVRDQMVLVPAVMAALSVLLVVAFRSLWCLLISLTTVGVAALWTAGAFALLGRPVDIIGSMVPISILVYGMVDPIFVLARVLQKQQAGHGKREAISEGLSELGLPCFLTSLTTALGFAAFLIAHQPTVRYYGLTVALGVVLSWVTSVTVLPILLSWVPLPERRFSAHDYTIWLERALRATWTVLRTRTRSTLVITAALLVAGAAFASRQHIDNLYVGELPRGSTQDDVRRFEQRLAGIVSLTVHLEGARDALKQPEVLRRIARIDQAMSKQPLVTGVSSLAELVAEANQAFHGGQLDERQVPNSRSLIAQYLALIDPGDRASFVTDDYSQAQISIAMADPGSEKMRTLAATLDEYVKQADFEALGVHAIVGGKGLVSYDELDDVVVGLLYGFALAFSAIVLLQWLVFRSLRIALISVVPNLLPVVACFVCLRVFDIHLRIDTALVLCISVGGLFNTTIHFAARVRQLARERNAQPDQVIESAMVSIGPPALFTAGALSVGFSVLFASSFAGLQALGLLTMVTLSVGFFSDMVVTAVLLRVGFAWRAPEPEPARAMAAGLV